MLSVNLKLIREGSIIEGPWQNIKFTAVTFSFKIERHI